MGINSSGQILKATSIVGGSQAVTIIIRILRTKLVAMILGTDGIGLLGLYDSVTGIVSTISGLGFPNSGVRQIAEKAGSQDKSGVARTAIALKWIAIVLGLGGMASSIIFCGFLSEITFGSKDYAFAIALLSLTVLFASMASGYNALLQGLRHIADIAKVNIYGTLFGTIAGLPLVFYWGKDGIVPYLIIMSVTTLVFSWWFSRTESIPDFKLSWKDFKSEFQPIIALGIVFMSTNLMASGTTYLVRIFVLRQLGMDGVGLYQASFTVSALYIGFILNAMGMDFYPRLTAVAGDNTACNQMVNEQINVGVLIAAPGMIATLTFAPLIMEIFYSAQFTPAYGILRWQMIGMFLRVLSWPLGYVIMAKGYGKLFFFTELVACTVHLLFLWVAIHFFGLEGAGIAFCAHYLVYLTMMIYVVRNVSGFAFIRFNIVNAGSVLAIMLATILLQKVMDRTLYIVYGAILTCLVSAFCIWKIRILMGSEVFAQLRLRRKRARCER